MSFIPLSPSTGETYLMLYVKGSLESGIYEFDVPSKSYKKVDNIERADKVYFVSLTPKRNTIADTMPSMTTIENQQGKSILRYHE